MDDFITLRNGEIGYRTSRGVAEGLLIYCAFRNSPAKPYRIASLLWTDGRVRIYSTTPV